MSSRSSAVAGLAHDLEAGLLEEPRDALSQEDRILGDDDAQLGLVGHSQRLVIRSAEISPFGTKPRAPLCSTCGPKSDSSRVEVRTIAGLSPPADSRARDLEAVDVR